MNAEERLEHLLESVFVPTNATVTIGDIRDNLGLTQAQYGVVRSTLDGAITNLKKSSDPTQKFQGLELQDALSAMLAGGISLSNPDRQSTIDLLATFGSWSDEVHDKVKAAGGVTKPRWQIEGYPAEPTLELIQTEIDKVSLSQQWASLLNESINAAVANGDRAGLKAALTAAVEVL